MMKEENMFVNLNVPCCVLLRRQRFVLGAVLVLVPVRKSCWPCATFGLLSFTRVVIISKAMCHVIWGKELGFGRQAVRLVDYYTTYLCLSASLILERSGVAGGTGGCNNINMGLDARKIVLFA